MPDRPNLAGRVLYDFTFWSSFTFFTFGFSLRRAGWANVPRTGPVLLVSNHQSMFDPVLVGLSSRRYLSYLARSNLFTQPVLAPLIRALNLLKQYADSDRAPVYYATTDDVPIEGVVYLEG